MYFSSGLVLRFSSNDGELASPPKEKRKNHKELSSTPPQGQTFASTSKSNKDLVTYALAEEASFM